MARAKQTTRAEARRRYRQTIAQDPLGGDGSVDGDGTAPPARPSASSTRSNAQAAPAPGLIGAFRGAYRQANYREDLAALPQLLQGRWFLISLGIVAIGFAGAIAVPTTLTLFLFQTVTLPPAIIPIFLVGFTAPRASYLLGLVVGIVDVALYSVYLAVVGGSGLPLGDYVLSGLAIGLPASVLFASGAAWYRRFLALSSGRRQQSGSAKGRSGAKASSRR